MKSIKELIVNLYEKYKEIINYVIFGVLATVVNLAVKYLLLFTIFDPKNSVQLQAAIVISWIAAVIFAYFTNRIYVFKSTNENKLKEFVGFVIARVSTLLMEMFIMWFFVTFLKLNSDMWVVVFTLISQAVVVIANYVFSKLFIFKNKEKNKKETKQEKAKQKQSKNKKEDKS